MRLLILCGRQVMFFLRSFSIFILVSLTFSGFAYSNQSGANHYGPYYAGPPAHATPAYPVYPPYQRGVRQAPYYNNRGWYPGYAYTAQPGRGRVPAPVTAVPVLKKRPQADAEVGKPIKLPAARKPASTTGNKLAFISTLLPHIEKENRRLLALRKDVESLFDELDAGSSLGKQDQQQLTELAKCYRVKPDPLTSEAARQELLRKIDIIPSSLALAQAANESAWGQSRFAQEANNLFGIWTYDEDKGLVPRNREQGKKHLVRIFDDVGASVRYYMHTLNSHPAYAGLRETRVDLRTSGNTIDGHKLATGLEKYSAKGQQYIDIIQGLIRKNKWAQLDMNNHPV
jgi:Bax protein